ncbi:MAG TPA: toll/interleukin-1 receptor domain-containing protein [Thermoanaerobaculia bacterium]|nr:toll/interleukin-1 receptor domain-containing protein [Thermoanaerobaculia bacterium]
MENSRQADGEVRELRGLVERIKRGDCVLVLGPRLAFKADDPERRPLDEMLAAELLESIGAAGPASLRRAADLYYRETRDREVLEITVRDFYEREASATTTFHRDLAALPFRLCISASPDNLMLRAFEAAEKTPQEGHYNFREPATARLLMPGVEKPLIYHLFGHCEDPGSLVLTEGDLIEFLVAIVKGTPPVPDQVRSLLADPSASFLFLGFGFHNWYLRVLLQVMNVYGRRSKALAFEDEQFFDHPEHEQATAFFTDRLIEFRHLRWDAFARQLREAYEAGGRPAPGTPPRATPPRPAAPAASLAERAPKAFVSYASEDRDAVEQLAAQLEARGIDVWQDKQDLRAGDNWDNTLKDVISRRVDYVIVVQTEAMTSRVEGVFHREIAAALIRQGNMADFRFVIPIKVGDCPMLASLNHVHAIDVSAAGGIEALTTSIEEDWQRRLGREGRAIA